MEILTRRGFMQMNASSVAAVCSRTPSDREQSEAPTLPFAVVFEVQTTAQTHEAYLQTARKLRPMLDDIPGFISIERSSSLSKEHRLLSLSYWSDEAALVQWRSTGEHHAAQQAGRDSIFADYRLRVGPVLLRELKGGESLSEPASGYNRPPFHSRRYMSLMRINGISEPKQFEASLSKFLASIEMPELDSYRSLSTPGRYFLSLPSTEWVERNPSIGTIAECLDRAARFQRIISPAPGSGAGLWNGGEGSSPAVFSRKGEQPQGWGGLR